VFHKKAFAVVHSSGALQSLFISLGALGQLFKAERKGEWTYHW
jgi:hypothetical protein